MKIFSKHLFIFLLMFSSVSIYSQTDKSSDRVIKVKRFKYKPEQLTNSDIVQMHKKGVTDDSIINLIRRSLTYFDLTTEDLISLKKDSISSSIIKVMLNKTYSSINSKSYVSISKSSADANSLFNHDYNNAYLNSYKKKTFYRNIVYFNFWDLQSSDSMEADNSIIVNSYWKNLKLENKALTAYQKEIINFIQAKSYKVDSAMYLIDSLLDDYPLTDTILRKVTGTKGEGVRASPEKALNERVIQENSTRNNYIAKPRIVMGKAQTNNDQTSKKTSTSSHVFENYFGKCKNKFPTKSEDLMASKNPIYTITKQNYQLYKEVFPDLLFEKDDYYVIQNYIKYVPIICGRTQLNVGVGIRIIVRILPLDSIQACYTLEEIVKQTNEERVKSYFTFVALGLPINSDFYQAIILDSDGYNIAKSVVFNFFQPLSEPQAKINAVVFENN